jgi:N utilization substance protein A
VESYRAALEEAQAQGLPYPFITPAALERFRRREERAALGLDEEYPEKLRLEEELEEDDRLEEDWVEEDEDFDYDAEFDIAQPKA